MRANPNNTTEYAYSRSFANRAASMITDTLPWKLLSSLFKSNSVSIMPNDAPPEFIEISLFKIKESNYELYEKIKVLDEATQQVLCLRFGLYDGQKKNLYQISTIVGLPTEKVRDILGKGLFSLRQKNILMNN